MTFHPYDENFEFMDKSAAIWQDKKERILRRRLRKHRMRRWQHRVQRPSRYVHGNMVQLLVNAQPWLADTWSFLKRQEWQQI